MWLSVWSKMQMIRIWSLSAASLPTCPGKEAVNWMSCLSTELVLQHGP